MSKYIRKADIILLIVLIITGVASSVALAMSHSGGSRVVIESGGELYAEYSLFEDRVIEVPAPGSMKLSEDAEKDPSSGGGSDQHDHSSYNSYNIVEISGGHVTVTEASCRNQVCVRHRPISASGESIVCLPNRLSVRIEGGDTEKGGGYDSVTS